MQTIKLKPGRDKNAMLRHPWIFSGAPAKTPAGIAPGEIVRVTNHKAEFVAYGYFNAKSQISVRLMEWDERIEINSAWWQDKLRESIARRAALLTGNDTDSCRLVFGESDFLPGLIIDRYASYIVIQALTAGIERAKGELVKILDELLHPTGIYEKSDPASRALEGLPDSSGVLVGDDPPDIITIMENGHRFGVDIKSGQKTAFYLDQRDNRKLVAEYAHDRDILDCFAYSGGFSVYGLTAGAKSATIVDSSNQSLRLVSENLKLNGLKQKPVEIIEADVFKTLRRFRDDGRMFDMVILDPPKFAPNKASLKKALSAYKDINLLASQITRPDGILGTFSCSGAVDTQTLQTVLFWAGTDSGRQIQILRTLSQAEDHPRLATFPESEYLKGFICRVI
jgi:23S rRNA (cytosine1962-C5)-methyltransferase